VRFQREAFGMADRLVAVSSRDQATLCDVGLRAEVAPNPADSRLFDLDRLPEPRHIVAEQYGLRLPAGRICLFVGSLHEPNVIAAARIRELARRMHGMAEAANIGFVIAGGCAPPGRHGNLLALGRVDDALLLALYAFADLVPIPLPFGTGTSLATIEAMAGGKVVLGTATAFRGLEVRSGMEAVIEDVLDRYPERIVGLLADDAERTRDIGTVVRYAVWLSHCISRISADAAVSHRDSRCRGGRPILVDSHEAVVTNRNGGTRGRVTQVTAPGIYPLSIYQISSQICLGSDKATYL
jgi:glycosyltransferase involved in cell wall biosynthesis